MNKLACTGIHCFPLPTDMNQSRQHFLSTAAFSGIHFKIRMFKVFVSGTQCTQRHPLHAFRNCRPPKTTANIQNTHFWPCNALSRMTFITTTVMILNIASSRLTTQISIRTAFLRYKYTSKVSRST